METSLSTKTCVVLVALAVGLTAVPVSATVIDFADPAADPYIGDRLVPGSDGQADGMSDETFGSEPAMGVSVFDTPSIDVNWGFDFAGPNSDHWIAVYRTDPNNTECFFTPNGFEDTNRAPEPVTLTAEGGWLVKLQTIAIRSGGNQGSDTQSVVYVDGELIFDTGELSGSGGYLHDHVVDLSSIAPKQSHELTFDFYLDGQLACNNNAIRLLEFTQTQGGDRIPGDANEDGKVTDADAAILATNWQRTGDATWGMGDFNNDKSVTDADAAILATHWQEGVTEAAVAVPEPSAPVALLGIVLGGMIALYRRRQDNR